MEYYKILSDPRRFMKIPTILPFQHYKPREDVEHFKSLLICKDESQLIQLLTKRSSAQRTEIVNCYKEVYEKDLIEEVKSIFSSKFRKVLVAMLQSPFDFLARELEIAMNSMITDHELLSEVLCTRSNEKIKGITEAYQWIFGKTFECALDINHDLSIEYKHLLTFLINNSRDETRDTDEERAKESAALIHNTFESGEKFESAKVIIRILSHESYNQICLITDEYRLISGCSLHETLKSNLSGDIQYASVAIVKSAICKPQYYAARIEESLNKTFRRDDHTLIRVFVSRAEIDLEEIKREYMRNYHKTLYNAIRSDLSGPYKEIMLALLNTP